MKNLLFRTLTGAIFATLVIGSIILGSWAFIILFGFFTIVGTLEFYRMVSAKKLVSPILIPGVLTSFLSFVSFSTVMSGYMPNSFLFFPLLLALILSVFELYRKQKEPILDIAITVFPILFVALPFALGTLILNQPIQPNYIFLLAFFAILWTNDTMAYLTGMSVGKHRLFERISPKKSWEGFLGGLFFSVVIGVVIGWVSEVNTWYFWVGYAIIISLAGTMGDLVESLFKRSSGIKDSGSILPGHGGVLDRFDGALLAFPFATAYIILLF